MGTNSPTQTGTADIDQKYITFALGEEEYGIPVLQVWEIVKIESLIRIPRARDYFLGFLDLRGHVLPVIDLKKKLGLQGQGSERLNRAIIIQTAGRRVGLAVDRVLHVLNFPPENVDSGPPTMKSSSSKYIAGVGKHKDQFIILMNLQNLFTRDEITEFGVDDPSATPQGAR